ncbi:hypothetical protein KP509_29G083100 [Ceratopteris richardii]|uniref:C2H2-type domain-containing protein n=1 Tax=Ceratopteris richardii TaxID=49495 RepID=A0A8T2RAA5_CERRI|nr:hypothetical protein KP509_29G083100 [Ceratopteris richardii]
MQWPLLKAPLLFLPGLRFPLPPPVSPPVQVLSHFLLRRMPPEWSLHFELFLPMCSHFSCVSMTCAVHFSRRSSSVAHFAFRKHDMSMTCITYPQ